MSPKKTGLFIACLLISTAHASSFNEVRKRVYAEPLKTLPSYNLPLAKAIFNALRNLSGELIDRARKTLSDPSDFKPAAPKLIHPVGICAEGIWTVHTPSFATGLLSPKENGSASQVRAMVRFSIATNDPVYKKGKKRNFAMAVKLFPTTNDDESVTTTNVFTLDQTGLTGDDRKSFFFSAKNGPDDIFFTNDVPGKGFLAWLGQRTFEKLDPPSTFRALYPLAQVGTDGYRVANSVSPRWLYFFPRMTPKPGPVPADFRDEIKMYGPHEIKFDLVLPVQYGVEKQLTIGTLELLKPVVSSVCDLELTFHHAPENRALEGQK